MTRVRSYRRKDGTYVRGHYRKNTRTTSSRIYQRLAPDEVRAGVRSTGPYVEGVWKKKRSKR